MLSVAALLNPDQPERSPRGTPLPSSPTSSVYITSSSHDSPHVSPLSSFKKQKISKDGAVFAKGKIMGVINYPPFEELDDAQIREVERFRVFPMRKIAEYSRHIPYNSEKKTFLEKTGRESFEVFQYTFKLPGEEKEYTVMWDYNIGLVRITPFFKCCQYSKTTPAKMLNMNPGLKDITHSITGGALAAQGYWMPFPCALAICATFCSPLAPALIPIFGPSFPSVCVPPEAPEHGRFVIDRSIITAATIEAENYRLLYRNMSITSSPTSTSRDSSSPQLSANNVSSRPIAPQLGRRLGIKRAVQAGEYNTSVGMNTGTPTDTEMEFGSSEGISERVGSPATPMSSMGSPAFQPPQHGWRATNHVSHHTNSNILVPRQQKLAADTNPWLSSIPRSAAEETGGLTAPATTPAVATATAWRSVKRRVEAVEDDDEGSRDLDEEQASAGDAKSVETIRVDATDYSTIGPEERNAALLLMRLSVQDWEMGQARRLGAQLASASGDNEGGKEPTAKRRKGTSV